MVKRFRILSIFILLVFLCGCSSYRYYEKDGLSCIKINKHNNSKDNSAFVDSFLPSLQFETLEEMRNNVVSGNLTEKQYGQLERMVADGLLTLPINVNSPPVPNFPKAWNLKLNTVSLYSYMFSLSYTSNTNDANDETYVRFEHTPTDGYISSFVEGTSGNETKYIISDQTKTLYITKKSTTMRVGVAIGDHKYDIHIYAPYDWLGRMPADEELLQIDIQYLDLNS